MIHDLIYSRISDLSLTQTALISGSGASMSAIGALSATTEISWIQLITVGMSFLGVILSVGLAVLKFVQEWREMNRRRTENTAWQTASTLDRKDMTNRIDKLERDK